MLSIALVVKRTNTAFLSLVYIFFYLIGERKKIKLIIFT